MKALNQHLRGLADGSVALSVELKHWEGIKRHVGRVYVYWPFVAFKTIARDVNITHAPTGLRVLTSEIPTTLKAAKDWIVRLKRCGDWEFTSPSGKKARTVRRVADTRKIIPRVTRIS